MSEAKLLYVAPSTRANKRYMGHFDDGFITHFGDPNYQNYTDHKDEKRKNAYIRRHINEAHLWESMPYSPAALSYYILWGPTTDLNENIRRYKKRFNI